MSFLMSVRRLLGRSSAAKRPVTRATLGLTCLEGRSLPSATVFAAGRNAEIEHAAEVRQEPQAEMNHRGGTGQAGDVRREDRRADRATEVKDVRREDRRADRTGGHGAYDPAGHDAGHPEVRHGGADDGPNHR
jgi:hypothetical protein